MIKPQDLKFKHFCMSIGNLPSSYVESLSYYECLMWLCKYLKDTVIPTVNNNAEAVTELQGLYVELKSYVDNYFDNLDVQEEINTKLDDMVESGELQEIISDYLNSQALFIYNTLDDLVNAENLINGSTAKTLGFYSKNDGGGALYKIRTITNEDEVDGSTIIAMQTSDDLVAELLYGKELNILQLGAKAEVDFDNTSIFEKALSLNCKDIFIPNGIYEVGQLTINGYHLKGSTGTTLQCNEECVTWIDIKTMSIIENIRFYGHHLCDKIDLTGSVQVHNITKIENCIFYEMNGAGLENNTIEITIDKCSFHHNNIGLLLKNVGNMVTNCYAYSNVSHGFSIINGTNTLSNCKSHNNGGYGYEITGSYITVSSCESQQNKGGSILCDDSTHNAIIDDFDIVGDSTVSESDTTQYPVIRLLGTDNYIKATIQPFFYNGSNWLSYPSAIIDLTKKSGSSYLQPTNNHIELKTYQASNYAKEQAESQYPLLSYSPIIASYNQGQSNKIIFNDLEYRTEIYPEYNTNVYPSRSTKIGNNKDDYIIEIPASIINSMSVDEGSVVFQSNETFDDTLFLNPYYTGKAYPINYEGKVKAFISMKFIGTVNSADVVASGDPANGTKPNAMDSADSIHKNYVTTNIPYVNNIISKPNYTDDSLKLRVNIEIWKLEAFTATEPLLINIKGAKLLNDNVTKIQ